jgi:phosphate transport system substrate-binding protein
MYQRALGWCGTFLVLAGTAACRKKPETNAPDARSCGDENGAAVCVVGAGPEPARALYARWASQYGKQVPGVHVSHVLLDADTAVRRLQAGAVDFATTSLAVESAAGAAQKIQSLPLTLGAVALIYHETGIGPGLRVSAKALSRMFSGRPANWNDPLVADANPDKKLPTSQIVVVQANPGSLADGSARQYLSRAASGWGEAPHARGEKPEPADDSEGDAKAAQAVQGTAGSVALVALSHAFVEGVAVAALENRAGRYVAPSPGTMEAAAQGVALTDSLTPSLLDAAGPEAYPISFFSYVLVPEDSPDRVRGEALLGFLWWASHDGQAVAEPMRGARLPARVVAALEGRLKELKAGGRQVLAGP